MTEIEMTSSATDALVGKYIRTMAAIEWEFRRILTLVSGGLDARPVRDDKSLEVMTDDNFVRDLSTMA